MPKRWSPVRLDNPSGGAREAGEWGIRLFDKDRGFSHELPLRFPDKQAAKKEIREWKEADEDE